MKKGFGRYAYVTGLPGVGVGTVGQPSSLAPMATGGAGGFNWSPSDITNAVSSAGQALGGILSGVGSLIGGVNSNKDTTQNGTTNNGQLIPPNTTAKNSGSNTNLWWIIGGGVLLLGLVVALVLKRK